MLSINFYNKQNKDFIEIEVSDEIYEKLAEIGLSRNFKYKGYKVILDEDEENIYATELNDMNRKKFKDLINDELVKFLSSEILPIIKKLDENSKENNCVLKDQSIYLEVLIKTLDCLKDPNNIFFSYE